LRAVRPCDAGASDRPVQRTGFRICGAARERRIGRVAKSEKVNLRKYQNRRAAMMERVE